MNAEELKSAITGTKSLDFCREYLFLSPQAWLFENDPKGQIVGTYHDFRMSLATILDENPNNICIVGSAKFGFSLSPKPEKAYQAFTVESDVDLVIISTKLFTEIWDAYRAAYYSGHTSLKKDHAGEVFRNFIVVKHNQLVEEETTYLTEISKKISTLQREMTVKHGIAYDINYRVYASYRDAENYHTAGIDKIKRLGVTV